MIYSMTGFGKSEYLASDHKTIVEIRSVNSKQLDLQIKLGSLFRDREADIRALVQKILERGKCDLSIYTQSTGESSDEKAFTPINWQAVRYYMDDYKANVTELQLPMTMGGKIPDDIMATIMRYPDVLSRSEQTITLLSDEEWESLRGAIAEAVEAYDSFRAQEGESLYRMFEEKLSGIESLLAEVEPYEATRVDTIRCRLENNLEELSHKTKVEIDKNRLEAEMIYYLEKLDITEEKVRLRNHIRYFRETMTATGEVGSRGAGKKLGFIAQEMGREINTLGSKSNQSEMQVIVVEMKDLLEQIKEQVLNVL